MKRKIIWLWVFFVPVKNLIAQQNPSESGNEQQIETLVDAGENLTEDDNYYQELLKYSKDPLDLNTAGKEELQELHWLSDLQIDNFIRYRKIVGKLVSIYELQTVPAWDSYSIRRILPFIKVSSAEQKENLHTVMEEGINTILIRYSRVLEKAEGYDRGTPGNKYLGDRNKLFMRYRYRFKNNWQFGLTGEKDAGEQFFKGTQKQGFDFYSFHFFKKGEGIFKSLAIGDFTVNMGQGLIQWQSMVFGKSLFTTGIKRQSAVIKPYSSAGEYHFMRGAGITLRVKNTEASIFGSVRKLDANQREDSLFSYSLVSALITNGYHRTVSEMADRHSLTRVSFGARLLWEKNGLLLGLNGVTHRFSLPLVKKEEPYNLFALKGRVFSNISVDYGYTIRNLHLFGELAMDGRFHYALVNGLLISVDPRVDFSVLYRNRSRAYQAPYGNAFAETSAPSGEKGLYAGISLRPGENWRVDGYFDLFSFPWLKKEADAPSFGSEYAVQLTCQQGKIWEIYTRYRSIRKQQNILENQSAMNLLVKVPVQNWRFNMDYRISARWKIRNRVELLWYDSKGEHPENGFLAFFDVLYRSGRKKSGSGLRLQYFETSGYKSGIYAFENDVLYYFYIPNFYYTGCRYYLNFDFFLSKKMTFWVKWAQSLYFDKQTVGSELETIGRNRKSEIRWQLRIIF